MKTAVVFLADGLEECEGLIVVDLLRRAGVNVITASVTGKREITSSHKIMFFADALAEEVDFAASDIIVLPGGMPGTTNLAASRIVQEQCRAFAKADGAVGEETAGVKADGVADEEAADAKAGGVVGEESAGVKADGVVGEESAGVKTDGVVGEGITDETATKASGEEFTDGVSDDQVYGGKKLAAICAAPSVLAELGLLDGKAATCHPGFEDKMAGACLTGSSVAVSGNIITGQGLGAAIPFALELVRQLVDAETADRIAEGICYRG